MASAVVGAGLGNHTGSKAPPTSNPAGSQWLLFSQNRPNPPNYPDIVDNESYFQPVNSGSVNELSPSQNSERELSPGSDNPGRASHASGGRTAATQARQDIPPSRQEMSGEVQPPLYPVLPQDPNIPPPPNNGTRPPQIPSYRQIQTRDISVGISARLDSHVDALPDLLHSHVATPVTPVRPNQHRQTRNGERRNRAVDPRSRNQSRHRTHESSTRTARQGHRGRTRSASSLHSDDGACKEPCVKCFVKLTSFRWVLVVLSLLGVCCVVTGIVLAALHAAGNSFLFLAIMFIGLGVLLVIVVGVGWKCTPRGHEPLHALFNIGDFRRRRDRHTRRAYRQRDSNWYGGVMYPEFQYRRPPPTYAASMQEYQQQLLMAQQQYMQQSNGNGESLPSSPPPSYRSRTSTIHSGIHIAFPPDSDQPNSRPPTYRSSASTVGRRGPVRPPLPRDQDRGENLPGGDVSFAGPDISPVSVTSEGVQTSAPSSANVERTPSDSTSAGVSSPESMPGSSQSIPSPSSANVPSLTSACADSTNSEQSVIHGESGGGAASSVSSSSASGPSKPKDNNIDSELQQTLKSLDEITSLAMDAEERSRSHEQTEEPERFQTAL